MQSQLIYLHGKPLTVFFTKSGGGWASWETPPDPVEIEIEAVHWNGTDVTELLEAALDGGINDLAQYID